MRNEIKTKPVNFPSDISSFIINAMDNNHKISPFIKLFWEKQQSAFSRKSIGKYHQSTMLIRFCLSLATNSGSADDKLRISNMLAFPSRRTLREINAIKPTVGFSLKVIAELCSLTKYILVTCKNIFL